MFSIITFAVKLLIIIRLTCSTLQYNSYGGNHLKFIAFHVKHSFYLHYFGYPKIENRTNSTLIDISIFCNRNISQENNVGTLFGTVFRPFLTANLIPSVLCPNNRGGWGWLGHGVEWDRGIKNSK